MKLTFHIVSCIVNGLTDLRDFEWTYTNLATDVELFDDEMMDVVEKHKRANLEITNLTTFVTKYTIPQIQEVRNFLEFAVGFLGKQNKAVWEIWDVDFLYHLENSFDVTYLHYKDSLQ